MCLVYGERFYPIRSQDLAGNVYVLDSLSLFTLFRAKPEMPSYSPHCGKARWLVGDKEITSDFDNNLKKRAMFPLRLQHRAAENHVRDLFSGIRLASKHLPFQIYVANQWDILTLVGGGGGGKYGVSVVYRRLWLCENVWKRVNYLPNRKQQPLWSTATGEYLWLTNPLLSFTTSTLMWTAHTQKIKFYCNVLYSFLFNDWCSSSIPK